ncbi:MAG: ATP-binding cassette domain-containing protein [Methylomonas sp.]|uniref:ATP-binding cassette domain-containing protein n=1 Tax=Methylomonas sp. TaxID=418 RepID=UPI0025D38F05|nr:ATP-binding cassette domain-containing protein [Methylomonas sp.]MCK9608778.1 ATP-binding cassette domain-containing protein [Methylomonas sp.]
MFKQQTIELRTSYNRERKIISLKQGKRYVLGNSDGNEIVLQGQDILQQHALLQLLPTGLHLEPIAQSAVAINGTSINAATPLKNGDWLSLGSSLFQISFSEPHAAASSPSSQAAAKSAILTIGRHPGCDLYISSPLVSREHAKLYCGQKGVELEDLNSTNGTFVNGRRLTDRMFLQQGDRVAIASFTYLFTGEALEPVDTSGRVGIEVRGLYKEVADRSSHQIKRLLDDINLVIEPGEFVAIFGTSGSGKSTLLDALNARRPATGGTILYNGTDLYACLDSFRSAIGYVPQQDIVHRKISIRRALQYTARLRLPPDTATEEAEEYIARVLEKVELTEKADLPIDTPAPLSGGQLKRVSLAVELVANPNILYLDEVTSGLDAGTDKRMMHLFADLAADQKTVICVTHTLENIDVCHQVILLHRGKLVYFGPPAEATGYFGVNRLSDVYELLESNSADFWAQRYRSSGIYNHYVLERMNREAAGQQADHSSLGLQLLRPRRSWFDMRQTATLIRRYFDLILADKKNLSILLLQAPLIAIVIGLVFDTEGLGLARATAESQIAFILVLSAIWFGTLNAARELVKELPIYLRERSVNLGIAPYLISKLLPLSALCLIQCIFLLGIVMSMITLPGNFLERLVTLFLSGLAATCMGLAVSAFVDSNDKAVAMAPILLIPQMVLSNAVVHLGEASQWVAKSSVISFWALDAMKTTLSADSLAIRDPSGQLIIPISGAFGKDLTMTAVLGGVFLGLAVLGLKLKDRKQ